MGCTLPEGTHLPSYNKVRTRGSIKRRPPSRRFRRSQSDCGDFRDYRAVEPSQENGAREENGDDVFASKSKDPGSPQLNQEAMADGVEGTPWSAEKPRRRNTCNSTEKPEELVRTPEEANAGEKVGQNPDTASQGHPEVQAPSQTGSPEAENGCGSPREETTQLAGRFREHAAVARETPASKPTRRKPPCSLPLFPPKVELGQNGEEKSPSGASHPPKIKVKSSPLIEKLQANLAFDPAALLPGASPKSPGLKAIVSPFHSPPSTPSSPGIRSHPSEAEEVPVSFDQPPEGTPAEEMLT